MRLPSVLMRAVHNAGSWKGGEKLCRTGQIWGLKAGRSIFTLRKAIVAFQSLWSRNFFLAKQTSSLNKVKFVGSDAPSIPINWRFAESVASLKGLEG